jgi:hypothetical protein
MRVVVLAMCLLSTPVWAQSPYQQGFDDGAILERNHQETLRWIDDQVAWQRRRDEESRANDPWEKWFRDHSQ